MLRTSVRRFAALAGGLGLSLVFASSATAAVVPIASGSHTFDRCTFSFRPFESCGGFLFSDNIGFHLSEDTTVFFDLTDLSASLAPPGSGYSTFNWSLYHQADIPLFTTPLTSGSGFGSPLGTTLLAAGDYKFVVSGAVTTYKPSFFSARRTNGASYGYEVDAVQPDVFTVKSEVAHAPIPAAALLFGSGLGILGLAGRRRKKNAG